MTEEKNMTEVWKDVEQSAHDAASAALAKSEAARNELAVVQKELDIAKKQFAEITAKIREITNLTAK